MCGISGIFQYSPSLVEADDIRAMLTQIQYRGPDESGVYIGEGVGMGSVRLSIIDLKHGQQPMSTLEEDLWIVYNGEIYNYIELRDDLKQLGYRFRTGSDTEVLLLLFKHYREKCVEKLNGQFAFAIWDTKRKELFIARDRVGIRPLFYCRSTDAFVFASEIKSIFESGVTHPVINPSSLDQVFTFWSIPSPGTIFEGIYELPPAHYMLISKKQFSIKSYWDYHFYTPGTVKQAISLDDAIDQFESLITDSINLRLRSDVQVAAYLSGGLDSSATTYFIKKLEPGILNTFSIGFDTEEYDETKYQQTVSSWLDTRHRTITCTTEDIALNFAKVLWHTEVPLLRTGAVPMLLLSELVNRNGIKVVITGEGADEFLGGYNIFKEALIREFWSRQPDSKIRPLLLQKLYPYLVQLQGRNRSLTKYFFGHRLTDTESPVYSHLIRWNNSSHIRQYFTEYLFNEPKSDPVEKLLDELPQGFNSLDLLSRAQWLESKLFLSGYLLSSQGDRVAMANSVEGRYPFLDHRVIDFCTQLPLSYKIKGLNEKYLLKQMMKERLPAEVITRPKQAYRAPVATSLISSNAPSYIQEMLSPRKLQEYGLFNPESVQKLLVKMKMGKTITETENMAVAGILSTQILANLFLSRDNPFRERTLRTQCPIHYDKNLKKNEYENI